MTIAPALLRTSLFQDDLERVLARTRDVWESLRGGHIFITGGTGFFGKWLLETFAFANNELELDAKMVVLSRDPRRFLRAMPQLRNSDCVSFHEGDVRTFEFPNGQFSHIIHAATDASAVLNEQSPETMFDVIMAGTRRVLAFCQAYEAERLLFISSGAVYGQQPVGMTHVCEDYFDAVDASSLTSAYAQGKRAAEEQCVEVSQRTVLNAAIARCFAFVGPHLPLDRHFAIGNFLHDALTGQSIIVRDGRPYRSYMYAADLAAWLWTILARGEDCRPYNVGSDQAIAIASVARLVSELTQTPVELVSTSAGESPAQPSYYVPDTTRAQRELGLVAETVLSDAITRTFAWHRERRTA